MDNKETNKNGHNVVGKLQTRLRLTDNKDRKRNKMMIQ